MNTCPHGFTFACVKCSKEQQERDRANVRAGKLRYALFVWRGDGHYQAKDARGGKLYQSEKTAQKQADKLYGTVETHDLPGGGFVVRSVYL